VLGPPSRQPTHPHPSKNARMDENKCRIVVNKCRIASRRQVRVAMKAARPSYDRVPVTMVVSDDVTRTNE
jgi:hypothetical protein